MSNLYGWNPESGKFDCRRCGACCYAPVKAPLYVVLDKNDVDRLSRKHADIIDPVAGQVKTRRTNLANGVVCAAFRGSAGDAGCSIYEDRPSACKMFDAGSWPCIETRKEVFGDQCQPDFPKE